MVFSGGGWGGEVLETGFHYTWKILSSLVPDTCKPVRPGRRKSQALPQWFQFESKGSPRFMFRVDGLIVEVKRKCQAIVRTPSRDL